jgi:hypothetical protein
MDREKTRGEEHMTPIDFVVYEGDSAPNTPVYQIAEAMHREITVRGPSGELEIVGYFFDPDTGNMVLEVG